MPAGGSRTPRRWALEWLHCFGWTRLSVLREIAPGVVSLRAEAPQAPPLTIKPGSYAWPDAVWS